MVKCAACLGVGLRGDEWSRQEETPKCVPAGEWDGLVYNLDGMSRHRE